MGWGGAGWHRVLTSTSTVIRSGSPAASDIIDAPSAFLRTPIRQIPREAIVTWDGVKWSGVGWDGKGWDGKGLDYM